LRRRQRRGCDGCDDNCTVTACGNGVRTGSEACDDGNTIDGDCCSASCVVEAAGGPCAGDGNGCTDDVCDGASFCGLANVAPCDDCSPCTGSDVCGGGACDGTSLCTACERCNEAVGCVVAPSGCISTFRKSTLAFSRDRLTWRAAALAVGAPRLADDHTLCMFDESGPAPRLLLAAHARGTTACDSNRQSCWHVPTRQHGPFVYRDSTATPDGFTEIRLFPDPAKGRVSVKVETPLSGLPLSFPLRVQLLTKHGCAEESYDGRDVVRNDASGFRATLRRR
jgi:cysteine-rich repeat protein